MSGKSDLAIVPYNEQPTLPQSPSIKSRLLDIGLTAGLTLQHVYEMNNDYSEMYGYCASFPTIHIFEFTSLFRIPRIAKALIDENYFVLFSTFLAWGLVLVPTYGLYISIIIDLSTLALSYTSIEHRVNEFIRTKIVNKFSNNKPQFKQEITLRDPNVLESAYSILGCKIEDDHTIKSITDKYHRKRNYLITEQAKLPPILEYQFSLIINNLDKAYRTIMNHLSKHPA